MTRKLIFKFRIYTYGKDHFEGDTECKGCLGDIFLQKKCSCGGLIHVEDSISSFDKDKIITREVCDKCEYQVQREKERIL